MTDNKEVLSYWEQLVEANTELANQLAKDRGFESAKDFITKTAAAMQAPNNAATIMNAEKAAGDFTASLALLILYQSIETPKISGIYDKLINVFDDGVIAEGNTKEYTVDLLTGHESFKETPFVPEKVSNPTVYAKLINMYKSANVLAKNSYQFKKSLTIRASQWVPFFMSGKLNEFIEKITVNMLKTYGLFKYNRIAELIASLKPSKTINGVAENAFTALTTEFFPALEEMLYADESYTYDNVNYPLVETSDKTDFVVVCGLKMKTQFTTGVLSQLFNAKFASIKSNISGANLYSLGKKLSIPNNDSTERIKTTNELYTPENTILVFDTGLIRHLLQIKRSESQAFAENLTIQLTLHVWGTMDIIPWKKCMKYVNDNLLTLPDGNKMGNLDELVETKTKKLKK